MATKSNDTTGKVKRSSTVKNKSATLLVLPKASSRRWPPS